MLKDSNGDFQSVMPPEGLLSKVRLLQSACLDRRLSHAAVRVLGIMLLDVPFPCFLGQETIAKRAGISINTVGRAIGELRGAGFLTVEHRRRMSSLYHFAWSSSTTDDGANNQAPPSMGFKLPHPWGLSSPTGGGGLHEETPRRDSRVSQNTEALKRFGEVAEKTATQPDADKTDRQSSIDRQSNETERLGEIDRQQSEFRAGPMVGGLTGHCHWTDRGTFISHDGKIEYTRQQVDAWREQYPVIGENIEGAIGAAMHAYENKPTAERRRIMPSYLFNRNRDARLAAEMSAQVAKAKVKREIERRAPKPPPPRPCI